MQSNDRPSDLAGKSPRQLLNASVIVLITGGVLAGLGLAFEVKGWLRVRALIRKLEALPGLGGGTEEVPSVVNELADTVIQRGDPS